MRLYTITLKRSDGQGTPVRRQVTRFSDEEAVESGRRELRRHLRTTGQFPHKFDTYVVSTSDPRRGFRIVGTGSAEDVT